MHEPLNESFIKSDLPNNTRTSLRRNVTRLEVLSAKAPSKSRKKGNL